MVLSIITINYKKPDLTIDCMNSLQTQFQEEFSNGEIELIVVDNASGDDSVELIKKAIKKNNYKNIKVIGNKENVGFSKGCNLGADSARGSILLFLNNDTVVNDRGIMDMVDYMNSHTEVSILGGQLSNPDGTSQPSSGKFYTPLNAFYFLLGMQRLGSIHKNPDKIAEVDWVKGALMMVRKKVFEDLGGFDEKIFMYIEDMEFCYRAHKKGFKTFFYPKVSVLHKDQGSSNRTFAIVNIYQNLLYFYKKHKSNNEYVFLKLLLRSKAFILIFLGKLLNNTYLTQTYEKALKVA